MHVFESISTGPGLVSASRLVQSVEQSRRLRCGSMSPSAGRRQAQKLHERPERRRRLRPKSLQAWTAARLRVFESEVRGMRQCPRIGCNALP